MKKQVRKVKKKVKSAKLFPPREVVIRCRNCGDDIEGEISWDDLCELEDDDGNIKPVLRSAYRRVEYEFSSDVYVCKDGAFCSADCVASWFSSGFSSMTMEEMERWIV